MPLVCGPRKSAGSSITSVRGLTLTAPLAKYMAEKDPVHSGMKPRPNPTSVVMKEVANAFLIHKRELQRVRRTVAADLGGVQGDVRSPSRAIRQASRGCRSTA